MSSRRNADAAGDRLATARPPHLPVVAPGWRPGVATDRSAGVHQSERLAAVFCSITTRTPLAQRKTPNAATRSLTKLISAPPTPSSASRPPPSALTESKSAPVRSARRSGVNSTTSAPPDRRRDSTGHAQTALQGEQQLRGQLEKDLAQAQRSPRRRREGSRRGDQIAWAGLPTRHQH
jgi:hypothetical protein